MKRGKASDKTKMTRSKMILTILKFAVLIVIVLGLPTYILFFRRDILDKYNSLEAAAAFFRLHHARSAVIYMAVQILQIIICVIPGQFFQIVAGMTFGFFMSLLYSLTGAFIGTTATYLLADVLGRDALRLIFGSEKMSYYVERLNSRRGLTIIFLLYLIPGLPKDILGYAAGASDIKYKPFIITSLVGRTPAMCASILAGSLYMSGRYKLLAFIAAIVIAAFIVCVIKRKKISSRIDSFYKKISK